MRRFPAVRIALSLLCAGISAAAGAQTPPSCTGLCLQQVSCPNNGTTSITGTVYAPNGTDPLPNVTVYIPNAPVDPFTPGVSCPVVGTPPSGSPLIGTVTDVKGNFELDNVPVGANIPLVIVSGRWRRQIVVPTTTACTSTPVDQTTTAMPQNQSQGDIPKIAIATGSADSVECVLLKMGMSRSEFTDPTGTGRINLFGGGGASGSGVILDAATPTQASLMGSPTLLNQYDVLMLPCEGGNYLKPAQELANLVNFANSGGRVYASHFSYSWMYQNHPFDTVANWIGGTASRTFFPDPNYATVNTGFTAGVTLAQWLQDLGVTTTLGQMQLQTLRNDITGINPPTQSWLTLNASGNPVMQFVFDTPIAAAGTVINQCGRVLYNEYHVENPSGSGTFPNECNLTAPMTPQEKLLEYMLFELTDEGGQPSLAPLTQDFGSQAIGFTSAPQTFTWTNNSSFAATVKSATATGDFSVVSNNCNGSVAGGASCQIVVTFTPTALGAETGTLTVVSGPSTLTASLTGTGTPGYSFSANTLAFGSLDVGASTKKTLTLTSLAAGPLPVPVFATGGAYSVSTAACGATIAAGASCPVTVTFLPTSTGEQDGTVGVNSTSLLYSGLNASLTGNGVDFTISLNPTSGSVVAGDTVSTTAAVTPIAGFAAALNITCNLGGAVAANCGANSTTLTPASPSSTFMVSLTTTSQYTIVGYGLGGGWLWLIALASGAMLWRARRRAGMAVRCTMVLFTLAAAASAMLFTGCTGKQPAQNASYTGPGNYSITVSATDGFLTHSATYKLTVTAK